MTEQKDGFYVIQKTWVKCSFCSGEGELVGDANKHASPVGCPKCKGKGEILEDEQIPLEEALFWREFNQSYQELKDDSQKWEQELKERYETGIITEKE